METTKRYRDELMERLDRILEEQLQRPRLTPGRKQSQAPEPWEVKPTSDKDEYA